MPRFIILTNARTGSTYLSTLLKSNPQVGVTDELLNDENRTFYENPLGHIERHIVEKEAKTRFVGLKIFPEQIFRHNLTFDQLVRSVGVKFVVVLWRKNAVETFVSRLIAEKTQKWYSSTPADTIESVRVPVAELENYLSDRLDEWRKIGAQWPVDLVPIFVEYEELVANPKATLEFIYEQMSVEEAEFRPRIYSERQNPAPLPVKVANWDELPTGLKNANIDVPDVLTDAINRSLCVPMKCMHVVPDREPPPPPPGWRYKVSEPYTPICAKANVLDALDANCVSSAGCWAQNMAAKLKAIFGCPVAQPCSSGFSALLLALQVCGVGPGDEIVVPSLTMVAVSNAVKFFNASPIFVDCLPDNYNPGYDNFADALTSKTKAVIVTHTFGVPTPGVEKLQELCRQRSIVLIEDISECVGVSVQLPQQQGTPPSLLGTFGDFACASMYANKMVQAGDGGFVLAKDPKVHSRLQSLVNHGFTPSYHFLHFERAVNAKINGLGAALACGSLDCLGEVLERRKQIANFYRLSLKDTPLHFSGPYGSSDTPWVFGVECQNKEQRRDLRIFLAKHGIETRNFFFPLHLQPVNQTTSGAQEITNQKCAKRAQKIQQLQNANKNAQNGSEIHESMHPSLPNAEHLASHCFYLPTHHQLTNADMQFICDVIAAFYKDKRATIGEAPKKSVEFHMRIRPGTYEPETLTFTGNGDVSVQKVSRNLPMTILNAHLNASKLLTNERWDDREGMKLQLYEHIEGTDRKNVALQLKPFLDYFESQDDFEPETVQPWLNENLADPICLEANQIETTTEPETLQLLCWLVGEMRPKNIVELGSLFGHTTMRMASKAASMCETLPTIFACDLFRWQAWMDTIVKSVRMSNNQLFVEIFQKNTAKHSHMIKPVYWPYASTDLPNELIDVQIDLAFIDFTQEASDLEVAYQMLRHNFIPNKTIIVFNGVTDSSIIFFTEHSTELTPLAQCNNTLSKTFLFGQRSKFKECPMSKKVNFQSTPEWTHHHKNAFHRAIESLKNVMHDPNSPVLFIPSVESWLCDMEDLGDAVKFQPWVGVIHEIVDNPEQFYVPDLRRLCESGHYRHILASCHGLFTLTNLQAKYLHENWPTDLPKIPIQPIVYPFIDPGLTITTSQKTVADQWANGKTVDLVLIGSFARDFNLFFRVQIPTNFRKVFLICDEKGRCFAKHAPNDVTVLERLPDEDYEKLLQNCVVFLSLLHNGAANTVVLECIARNVPIVCPSFSSCEEYLGKKYPLYYESEGNSILNLQQLLVKENVQRAVEYLKELKKNKFSLKSFVRSIQNSPVMRNVPGAREVHRPDWNPLPPFQQYDVTVLVCSYKRTHHLAAILEKLWSHQDFHGTMEILIWNNNEQRTGEVNRICQDYVRRSTNQKRLDVIQSTRNFFAVVRLAMPALMQSEKLLICDDDIMPASSFVSFFMGASQVYPLQLLCLRGHVFLPHKLNTKNIGSAWIQYKNLRFLDDFQPTQLIHFAHADACLIPKTLLRECASVDMPQPDFALVDDYWMSYILSHKFHRKLRKLSLADCTDLPCARTEDSDTPGLALYTRPEVVDAKLRMYLHHMLQGWPQWPADFQWPSSEKMAEMKRRKVACWDKAFLGYNISSHLSDRDVEDLCQMKVRHVRIGAVGLDDSARGEFNALVSDTENELTRLVGVIEKLAKRQIFVVVTLHSKIACENLWRQIAMALIGQENVIGYDLINEPFTKDEAELHLSRIDGENIDEGLNLLIEKYRSIIDGIRKIDRATPIIVEPSFWAHCQALNKKCFEPLLNADSNLVVSVHFYQPKLLVHRTFNKGRFSFPGDVPIHDDCKYPTVVAWNKAKIREILTCASKWCESRGVKLCVGEFGICRDIAGAAQYLQSVMEICRDLIVPCMLFSFRDPRWEAMDYEFGPIKELGCAKLALCQNPILQTVLSEISKTNCHL